MKRAILGAVAAALAIGAGAMSPAQAAEVENVPHQEVGSEIWGFCPEELVPFEVVHTWDVMVRDRSVLRDGLWQFADTGRGTETWEGNGKVFTLEQTWNARDAKVTDNGDGTLTIERRVSQNLVYSLDGTFLFRDSGLVEGAFLIDTVGTPDPEDDEFIDVVGDIVAHGRQDTAGRDFCEDLAQFLG